MCDGAPFSNELWPTISPRRLVSVGATDGRFEVH